jgi:hypothetical protein
MICVEHQLFLFLQTAIAAAGPGDPLFQAELHDTIFQTITRDRGLRIGDCRSTLAPSPDQTLGEFDALIELTGFVRVAGSDKTERLAARDAVVALAAAVTQLFFADQTLGGRVCDLLAGPVAREFISVNGQPFALARLPLVINPSGLPLPATREPLRGRQTDR